MGAGKSVGTYFLNFLKRLPRSPLPCRWRTSDSACGAMMKLCGVNSIRSGWHPSPARLLAWRRGR